MGDAALALLITLILTIRALLVGAPPFRTFSGMITCNISVKLVQQITSLFSDAAGFSLQITLVALRLSALVCGVVTLSKS